MKKVFPIVPAGRGPLITCGVAALVLVIIMVLAGRGPGVAAWIVDLVLGGILLLLASLAYASRHVRFEISPAGLAIRGDIYGRRLAFPSLLTGEAKVLDLGADPAHRPVLRTNGTGLPGYGSGWFKLANGEQALLFVTDRRVVYLPTREGYAVLLSVAEPEAFLQALRQEAGS